MPQVDVYGVSSTVTYYSDYYTVLWSSTIAPSFYGETNYLLNGVLYGYDYAYTIVFNSKERHGLISYVGEDSKWKGNSIRPVSK